jgi:hypothetical protein
MRWLASRYLTPVLALTVLLFAGAGRAGELDPEKGAFRKALKKAATAAAPSDGVAGGVLGNGRMRSANRVAAEILERRMLAQRAEDLKLLRQAEDADVVVVRGTYDRVQDVLRAVKVKHVVIPPGLVERLPLLATQTLMVNCPGNLSRAGVEKVRRFVKTGGYLVTTDWALTLLTRAFPGYVARGGRNTGNDVVAVHVHENNDPMLKHVKTLSEHPRWWLEGSSYPIKILDKQRVQVLISSHEMQRKYGESPIAVTFRYDDGKVLHMTSHFYLQQAKLVSQRERARGSAFAAAAGLPAKDLAALKAKGLDNVATGEINSAYSMQQVTANVLVSKQSANKALLAKYGKRARRDLKLRKTADKDSSAGAQVGKGYRLRVLKKAGKKVLVRDLQGNEGWADEPDLY